MFSWGGGREGGGSEWGGVGYIFACKCSRNEFVRNLSYFCARDQMCLFHALISGWWLVANSRGEHGFAPATFLEPVDVGQRSEEEEWREVEDDDRKSLC